MKTITLMILCTFSLLVLLTNCEQNKGNDNPSADLSADNTEQRENLLEKGHYLIDIMDCAVCHSPKIMTDRGPVPDPARLYSGFPENSTLPEIIPTKDWVLFSPDLTAAVGPWGVSFSANITPDETGIGNWSFEQFKTALTKGKHKGLENGRMLLPPMPWQAYSKLKEEDLQAMFQYLKTVAPIKNKVPTAITPDALSLK